MCITGDHSWKTMTLPFSITMERKLSLPIHSCTSHSVLWYHFQEGRMYLFSSFTSPKVDLISAITIQASLIAEELLMIATATIINKQKSHAKAHDWSLNITLPTHHGKTTWWMQQLMQHNVLDPTDNAKKTLVITRLRYHLLLPKYLNKHAIITCSHLQSCSKYQPWL